MHLMLVGSCISLAFQKIQHYSEKAEFQIDWEMPIWLSQRSWKLVQQIYVPDTTMLSALLYSPFIPYNNHMRWVSSTNYRCKNICNLITIWNFSKRRFSVIRMVLSNKFYLFNMDPIESNQYKRHEITRVRIWSNWLVPM